MAASTEIGPWRRQARRPRPGWTCWTRCAASRCWAYCWPICAISPASVPAGHLRDPGRRRAAADGRVAGRQGRDPVLAAVRRRFRHADACARRRGPALPPPAAVAAADRPGACLAAVVGRHPALLRAAGAAAVADGTLEPAPAGAGRHRRRPVRRAASGAVCESLAARRDAACAGGGRGAGGLLGPDQPRLGRQSGLRPAHAPGQLEPRRLRAGPPDGGRAGRHHAVQPSA